MFFTGDKSKGTLGERAVRPGRERERECVSASVRVCVRARNNGHLERADWGGLWLFFGERDSSAVRAPDS